MQLMIFILILLLLFVKNLNPHRKKKDKNLDAGIDQIINSHQIRIPHIVKGQQFHN